MASGVGVVGVASGVGVVGGVGVAGGVNAVAIWVGVLVWGISDGLISGVRCSSPPLCARDTEFQNTKCVYPDIQLCVYVYTH